MVAIIDAVHNSTVHKQSYSSEMDPMVCPITTTTTTMLTNVYTTTVLKIYVSYYKTQNL